MLQLHSPAWSVKPAEQTCLNAKEIIQIPKFHFATDDGCYVELASLTLFAAVWHVLV